MSQRVIVGLKPDTDVQPVKRVLRKAGIESVSGPAPYLPDVLVVTIPDDQDIDEFIRMALRVPGVRNAEPDSWQFTV